MFGKTRRDKPYYACAPRKGLLVPDGHPASLWVAEHYLLDGLNEFLTQHVFGAYRRSLLSTTLDERVTAERDEHAQHISAVEKALHDLDQPEPLARRLFEALRLEIHYDKDRHAARYRVTLAADTVRVAHQTAATALARDPSTSRDRKVPRDEKEGKRFPSVRCPRQDSNLRHTV
jgi:hypothetical protein